MSVPAPIWESPDGGHPRGQNGRVGFQTLGYSFATPEVLGPERYRAFCERVLMEQRERGYGCLHGIDDKGEHRSFLTENVSFLQRMVGRAGTREVLTDIGGYAPSGNFHWERSGWPDEWISGGWPIHWFEEDDP
jgi:hypothetical protein